MRTTQIYGRIILLRSDRGSCVVKIVKDTMVKHEQESEVRPTLLTSTVLSSVVNSQRNYPILVTRNGKLNM